jgi:hypothetical protein
MKNFRVTWGAESASVDAASVSDAWALFAQGLALARKFPKLYARKVEEIKAASVEKPAEEAKPKPAKAPRT